MASSDVCIQWEEIPMARAPQFVRVPDQRPPNARSTVAAKPPDELAARGREYDDVTF
jgi:hypothetical protein